MRGCEVDAAGEVPGSAACCIQGEGLAWSPETNLKHHAVQIQGLSMGLIPTFQRPHCPARSLYLVASAAP